MRARKISVVAMVAGLVGMAMLLASPAGADPGLTSGDGIAGDDSVASGTALAADGSVASGDAEAIEGSTASGDAIAINGSTASGCATALDDSTASGSSTAIDHSTASGGPACQTPAPAPEPGPAPSPAPVTPPAAHRPAPSPAPSPKLARTGSDTRPLVAAGLGTVLAGFLLVGVTTRRRLMAAISIADIFPRVDGNLAAQMYAAFGPSPTYRPGTHTD